jgi:hypothetical protein
VGVSTYGKKYKWECYNDKIRTVKAGYLTADDAHAARQLYLETGEVIEP